MLLKRWTKKSNQTSNNERNIPKKVEIPLSRPESTLSKREPGNSSRNSSPKDSKMKTSSSSISHLGVKNKEFMDSNSKAAHGKESNNKPSKQSKKKINMNPNPSSPLYTILYGDKANISQSTGNLHKVDLSQIHQNDRSTVSNLSQFKNANHSGISIAKSNTSGSTSVRNKSALSVQVRLHIYPCLINIVLFRVNLTK